METSGRATAVAVLDCADGTLRAELFQAARVPGSGQPLVPLVERALAESGVVAGAIGLLACAIGPGSFTGLRVGIATVKGIGLARGLPAVGVSTLRALAVSALEAGGAGGPAGEGAGVVIAPVVDAKKGEVYAAVFAGARGDAIVPEGAWSPAAFAARVRALGARGQVVLCGDGVGLVLAHLDGVAGLRDLGEAARVIRASAVGRLAIEAAARGEARGVEALEPAYHRSSEAEVAARKANPTASPASGRGSDSE